MPPEGFGISARNITVSTVGVVPGIIGLVQATEAMVMPVQLRVRGSTAQRSQRVSPAMGVGRASGSGPQ